MKESEENVNEELDNIEEVSDAPNDDLLDFIDLVNCVVYYYTSSAESDEIDPADNWKRQAGLTKKAIPEEVDDLVKQAFIKKLKDHV